MTITEAYRFTIEKIEELKAKGISVVFKDRQKESDHPDGQLPSGLWKHIQFVNVARTQAQEIFKMVKYLNLCGIRFDIGGESGKIDWELDWSFKYTGKDDEDWRDAIDECEENLMEFHWWG